MSQLLIKYSALYNALFIYSKIFPFEETCLALLRALIPLLSFCIHLLKNYTESLYKILMRSRVSTLSRCPQILFWDISACFSFGVCFCAFSDRTSPPYHHPTPVQPHQTSELPTVSKKVGLLYLKCEQTEQVSAQEWNLEALFGDSNPEKQAFACKSQAYERQVFCKFQRAPSRYQDERPEDSEYRFSISQNPALASFLDQKGGI